MRQRCVFGISFLFSFFCCCLQAQLVQCSSPPVALIIQLSDLHVSKFDQGSRLEDLEAFSQQLLSLWRPDSIVITGDLTDAKLPNGKGEQLRSEWREYKRLIRIMSENSGLQYKDVLDIRGNHDVFDMTRGGPLDHYMTLSARAARANDAEAGCYRRINIDPVYTLRHHSRGEQDVADAADSFAKNSRRLILSDEDVEEDRDVDLLISGRGSGSTGRGHGISTRSSKIGHIGGGIHGGRDRSSSSSSSSSNKSSSIHGGRGGIDGIVSSRSRHSKDGRVGVGVHSDVRRSSGSRRSSSGSSSSSSRRGLSASRDLRQLRQHSNAIPDVSGYEADISLDFDAQLSRRRLSSQREGQGDSGDGDGESSQGGASHVLGDKLALHHTKEHCPLAVMVGIDGSPEPGLRPATNFLSVIGPFMLRELDSQLRRLRAVLSLQGCTPSIIAYGHHTLSTIAYVPTPEIRHQMNGSGGWLEHMEQQAVGLMGAAADVSLFASHLGPLNSPSLPRGTRVEHVLGRWDASAYLCGHLHDTFGYRTHRMHPKRAADHAHGSEGGGFVAELEAADWKHARWFRLVTADEHAGVSFADFRFHRDLEDAGDAEEPYDIISIDKTRQVISYALAITSPPDARYYPLRSDHVGKANRALPLRVLILPLENRGHGRKRGAINPPSRVEGTWYCSPEGAKGSNAEKLNGSVELQLIELQRVGRPANLEHSQAMGLVEGMADLKDRGTNARWATPKTWLYEASLVDAPNVGLCKGHVWVQVKAYSSSGSKPSTSENRPVARRMLLGSATAGSTEGDQHIPLDLSLSERLILEIDWHVFGDTAFQVQALVLFVVLLLIPRFLPFFITSIFHALSHFCWASMLGGAYPCSSLPISHPHGGQGGSMSMSTASMGKGGGSGGSGGSVGGSADGGDKCLGSGAPTGGLLSASSLSSGATPQEGVLVGGPRLTMGLGTTVHHTVQPGLSEHAARHSSGSTATSAGANSHAGGLMQAHSLPTSALGVLAGSLVGGTQSTSPQRLAAFTWDTAGGTSVNSHHAHSHTMSSPPPPRLGSPAWTWNQVVGCFRTFWWLAYHLVLRPPAMLLLLCIATPLRDLGRVSVAHPVLWWSLLLFAVNLVVGPWFFGNFHYSAPGCMGSFLTSHGVYIYKTEGGIQGYDMIDAQDVSIITNVHMLTFVLPAYMWMASVVCSWSDLAAGKPEGVLLLTWRQLLVILLLLPIHYRLLGKMVAMYGWGAFWISPATGWAVPLAMWWLRHARNRVIKSRVD